jgi:hypothetical protein
MGKEASVSAEKCCMQYEIEGCPVRMQAVRGGACWGPAGTLLQGGLLPRVCACQRV